MTVIIYDYDPLYRLTEAVYTEAITATYRYDYDAVGNMTAYTETVGADTASVVRVFDEANHLLTFMDMEEGTTSFYYDNNGSLTQILPPGAGGGDWAGALRYGYNQRDLLITSTVYITDMGWTNQVQYIYDGEGGRVQQVDYTGPQPVTTTYTNDNSDLSTVLVATDGTTTTYNLIGLRLISQQTNQQTNHRYLLTDGLGSTRTEMVGSTVEAAATYEPFGKLLARTGETGTVYGYVGEQFDAASGLVYLRARYYPLILTSSSRGTRSPGMQHYRNPRMATAMLTIILSIMQIQQAWHESKSGLRPLSRLLLSTFPFRLVVTHCCPMLMQLRILHFSGHRR